MLSRMRGAAVECATVLAIAVVSLRLAVLFPCAGSRVQASTWQERDYLVWWQAHQLFRCEPEALNDWQLELVSNWHRCLSLLVKYQTSGLESLSDDECRFVVKMIDEVHPRRAKHPGYDQIRMAFQGRLMPGKDASP